MTGTELRGTPRLSAGLFADRDFRLLWTGETVSRLGSAVTAVALPLVAVVTLDAGPLAAGLLSAAVWLPWLLVGLPAGVWIGRWGRRAVLVRGNLVSAVLYASVPAAARSGVLTFAQLLLVALLAGTASVFLAAAHQAFLPDLLPPERLTEGNAKLQGGASVAQVAGPGAAGLAVQAFGAAAGLLADAVSFLVAAGALLLIRDRRTAAPEPDPAPLGRQVREGLAFVRRDPYLGAVLRYGAVANLALAGYQAVAVLFLIRELGVAPSAVGWLGAAGAFGGVAGAVLARPVTRRFGSARGVLLALLTAGPFGLLLPTARPGAGVLLYAGGLAVMVGGVVLANVVLGSFRQRYVPPALLDRVVSASMTANQATIPLGAVTGGALGEWLGLRPVMWLMILLLVASAGLLVASPLRRVRDLPDAWSGAEKK
ncbi:MFS transporter [Kitasatospora sp. NPDC059463]|uniref:MFS transporter n=1 Tax=unclassified Kitasatospora TaxID=2633591 RepID=UPI0036B341A5